MNKRSLQVLSSIQKSGKMFCDMLRLVALRCEMKDIFHLADYQFLIYAINLLIYSNYSVLNLFGSLEVFAIL